MRSVEARFNIMTKKFPFHSSFICYGREVRGQKFSRTMVAKYFRRLVDKDDYDRKDIMRLTDHFMRMTEKSSAFEEAKLQGKNTL